MRLSVSVWLWGWKQLGRRCRVVVRNIGTHMGYGPVLIILCHSMLCMYVHPSPFHHRPRTSFPSPVEVPGRRRVEGADSRRPWQKSQFNELGNSMIWQIQWIEQLNELKHINELKFDFQFIYWALQWIVQSMNWKVEFIFGLRHWTQSPSKTQPQIWHFSLMTNWNRLNP